MVKRGQKVRVQNEVQGQDTSVSVCYINWWLSRCGFNGRQMRKTPNKKARTDQTKLVFFGNKSD